MTTRNDGAAILEQVADRFDVYAGDQLALVQRGYFKDARATEARTRAAVWSDAADELREIAEKLSPDVSLAAREKEGRS